MKVLLSTTPFTADQFHYIRWPEFPVYNLQLLAACLIQDNHDVEIVSNLNCRFSPHRIDEAIITFKPQLVGISIPSAIGNIAVQQFLPSLMQAFPDIIFIAGGQYATIDFLNLLKIGFDIVVLGQGEKTIREVVTAVEKGDQLENIAGIVFRDTRKQIIKTPSRTCKTSLNDLPLPARELMSENRTIFGTGAAATMETSRGCPFQCRFCSVHEFWGTYQEKSNERIIQEMRALHAMGIREIFFVDIAFAVNASKTIALAKRMVEEGFDFKFSCFMRADTVVASPEAIELLTRAGLSYVFIGFESYNRIELEWMRKRTTPRINKQASHILRSNSVAIVGLHIYFLPGSKIRHAFKTYIQGMHRSDLFKCGSFVMYPDAPAAAELKHEKEILQTNNYDCHHVVDESRWRKILNQAALYTLMIWSVISPRQWLRLFSRNKNVASIVRLEYKTYLFRLLWWIRKKR